MNTIKFYNQKAFDTLLKNENSIGFRFFSETLDKMESIHEYFHDNMGKEKFQFLTLPQNTELVEQITGWARKARKKFKYCLVLGIGGSALGFQATQQALYGRYYHLHAIHQNLPQIFTVDNIDPETIAFLDAYCDWQHTLLVVISKSGTTLEPISQFLHYFDILVEKVGEEQALRQTVVITSPTSGALRKWVDVKNESTAKDEPTVVSFEVPDNIGGRFSVLTPVGLVPLALAGVDLKALMAGAQTTVDEFKEGNIREFGPYKFAAMAYTAEMSNKLPIVVMMAYADCLDHLTMWFRQLWAESLGKKVTVDGGPIHCGLTPAVALGATDQHSQIQLYMEGPANKFIIFVEVERFRHNPIITTNIQTFNKFKALKGLSYEKLLHIALESTKRALSDAGKPHASIVFPEVSPETLGQFIMFFEIATAAAGWLYNINPFDQPGVEAGKIYAKKMLEEKE